MTPEEKLAELNLELPPAPKAMGVYRPIVIVDDLAYLSGHVPMLPDGSLLQGTVGEDVDQQGGYDAARQVGLVMLSTLRNALGSLNRVQRIVKTFGVVNCTAEFTAHPAVINGFSELMAEVFGPDNGVGARSAIGANSLPANITAEVEAIFQIEP